MCLLPAGQTTVLSLSHIYSIELTAAVLATVPLPQFWHYVDTTGVKRLHLVTEYIAIVLWKVSVARVTK